ncbi:MAG TPA: hypothetical protein VME45_06390 [Stellaceae bacterium]|nr:hypothetical protein [Stellaceae bacterium]
MRSFEWSHVIWRIRRTPALLLIMIAVAFLLNFAVGVGTGQRQTLFYPMYRLRQTLAVALSIYRDPPLFGYRAYGSIDDLLVAKGFYIAYRQ